MRPPWLTGRKEPIIYLLLFFFSTSHYSYCQPNMKFTNTYLFGCFSEEPIKTIRLRAMPEKNKTQYPPPKSKLTKNKMIRDSLRWDKIINRFFFYTDTKFQGRLASGWTAEKPWRTDKEKNSTCSVGSHSKPENITFMTFSNLPATLKWVKVFNIGLKEYRAGWRLSHAKFQRSS